jgi:ABC-2 type transport system permease protein
MRPTFLIARREIAGYLRSWTGYIIIALVLFADGLLFNVFALGGPDKRSSEVLSLFFYFSSGTTMIASVFISMRLLAEEQQTGTINLLYSSPVRDSSIVWGKFLGALAFLTVMTLATAFMPAMILIHGKVSIGHLCAGYLGLLLLGAGSLAIGTFASSLTRMPILSAVISGVTIVALLMSWLLARVTERPLSDIFMALAFHGQHFQPFQSGIVHVRDAVYYLAVTYVALFGATRVLEARRWR